MAEEIKEIKGACRKGREREHLAWRVEEVKRLPDGPWSPFYPAQDIGWTDQTEDEITPFLDGEFGEVLREEGVVGWPGSWNDNDMHPFLRDAWAPRQTRWWHATSCGIIV